MTIDEQLSYLTKGCVDVVRVASAVGLQQDEALFEAGGGVGEELAGDGPGDAAVGEEGAELRENFAEGGVQRGGGFVTVAGFVEQPLRVLDVVGQDGDAQGDDGGDGDLQCVGRKHRHG